MKLCLTIALLLLANDLFLCFRIHHSRQITNTARFTPAYVLSNSDYISNVYSVISATHIDIFKYALSGAAAGGCRALSRGITFPFDTIKTFDQTSNSNTINNNSKTKIKVKNYFSGIVPAVVSAVPSNALFFIFYNSIEAYLFSFHDILYPDDNLDDHAIYKLLIRLFASAIATLPQNMIKIPAELLKQRAQLQPDYGVINIFKASLAKDGIAGLYTGGLAQLLREIPYNSFQMAFFEYFNESFGIIKEMFGSDKGAALIGLVAASLSSILTQPADVIKTKLMTADVVNPRDKPTHDLNKENLFSTEEDDLNLNINPLTKIIFLFEKNIVIKTWNDIIRNEGYRGLFVGFYPRLMIVSVGGMVYFYAAEVVDSLVAIQLTKK